GSRRDVVDQVVRRLDVDPVAGPQSAAHKRSRVDLAADRLRHPSLLRRIEAIRISRHGLREYEVGLAPIGAVLPEETRGKQLNFRAIQSVGQKRGRNVVQVGNSDGVLAHARKHEDGNERQSAFGHDLPLLGWIDHGDQKLAEMERNTLRAGGYGVTSWNRPMF